MLNQVQHDMKRSESNYYFPFNMLIRKNSKPKLIRKFAHFLNTDYALEKNDK